jgi:hypothetical protein
MLSKCQLIMATGGTIAQDLTMQWSTLSGFMQDLSLMVIDEGQQYGTDREIATISLLKQQSLILWTGDAQQTPRGIARTAPNAKRSRVARNPFNPSKTRPGNSFAPPLVYAA